MMTLEPQIHERQLHVTKRYRVRSFALFRLRGAIRDREPVRRTFWINRVRITADWFVTRFEPLNEQYVEVEFLAITT